MAAFADQIFTNKVRAVAQEEALIAGTAGRLADGVFRERCLRALDELGASGPARTVSADSVFREKVRAAGAFLSIPGV